ncbi:MAG: hypothetical protein LUH02_04450, partial [Erysipelotrichaceae bacterium]|nr:hypothetical protein [Erysipelotrichaceae bacterium]
SYPAILAFMMWFTVTPYSWSIGDMAAYTPAVEGTMGAQTSTVTISQLLEEVLNSGFVAEYNTFSSDTFADVTNSVKLPLIKKRNNIVDTPVKGKKLKEANIIPYHDIYILSFVFEDATEVEMINEKPKHICAIDLGVNNFAAITNNIGKECLLFKGEVFMSKN